MVLVGEFAVGRNFVRRKIQNQHAIDAGLGSFLVEFFESVDVDRIEVGVEDDGNIRDKTDTAHGLQHFVQSGSGLEGTLGAQLIDHAVGQRIGERNSKLDHIDASLGQSRHQTLGSLEGRIAGRDVSDKSAAVDRAQGGELFVDPVRHSRTVLGPTARGSNILRVPCGDRRLSNDRA